MKATFEIDDDLYRRLKARAALGGEKVKDLVAEAVRRILQEPSPGPERRRGELPLVKTKRTRPLEIPDDIAFRVEVHDDLERHADSLR